MFLDDAIVEAVQTESNLLVARRIVVVVEHLSDGVGRDHQGAPSLVNVLSKLAAYWVLCECGVEIGKAGLDGWEKKTSRLGDEIDSLNHQIQTIKSPSKKAAMRDELEKLKVQLDAIDREWEEAQDETDAYRELFGDACGFCVSECSVVANDVFNAALVGFYPSHSMHGQGLSEDRMSEIVSRLANLHRDNWKAQPWANPTKPTMLAAKRVAQNKRDSFIVRNRKHVGTVEGPFNQDNPLKELNAEVKPTSDANVPTITISVTPTDSGKSDRKGVSLQDAALAANDDAPELWSETKKSWQQNHRRHHLPTPIGKAESHSQMDLYDLNELCDAIAKLETHELAEFCRKRLRYKLRDVARTF